MHIMLYYNNDRTWIFLLMRIESIRRLSRQIHDRIEQSDQRYYCITLRLNKSFHMKLSLNEPFNINVNCHLNLFN